MLLFVVYFSLNKQLTLVNIYFYLLLCIMIYLNNSYVDNEKIVAIDNKLLIDKAVYIASKMLINIGIVIPEERVIFSMVTKEQMQQLAPGLSAVGLCSHILGVHKIYLLENMPYLYLQSVIAHELGHVWINENKINIPKFEEEGFCQLLSYYILSIDFSLTGNHEVGKLEAFDDCIYGDGFRFMKKKLDSLGWSQLLTLMKF